MQKFGTDYRGSRLIGLRHALANAVYRRAADRGELLGLLDIIYSSGPEPPGDGRRA